MERGLRSGTKQNYPLRFHKKQFFFRFPRIIRGFCLFPPVFELPAAQAPAIDAHLCSFCVEKCGGNTEFRMRDIGAEPRDNSQRAEGNSKENKTHCTIPIPFQKFGKCST